ncbi:MAG: hypothetical protein LCH52_08575 [Bacteroidetes bacterium]|nr:hypothetical protein [Bacteroidota bacterium]
MRITDKSEQVFRAKISFDEVGAVSAASFDTMGKGCSIHLSIGRPIEEILALLSKTVINSSDKPVGRLTVENVEKSNCEVHQDEKEEKNFHGNITGPNQARSLSDIQKSLLAAYCQPVESFI